MIRCRILFLFVLILLFCIDSKIECQSLSGFSGYFNIPSADLSKDKSFKFGYNQLNQKANFYQGKYRLDVGYVNIGYLPILEVGIRITRPRDFKTEKKTTWDRMIALRSQMLKEKKYFPAVVIGFQGFYTSTQSASFFNSTYLVMTKNFPIKNIFKNIGLTLGFGSDIIPATTYQYIGLFGGVKITPHHIKWLDLMVDYDAKYWNAGTRITILNHFNMLAGLECLKYFSWGVSYQFLLP